MNIDHYIKSVRTDEIKFEIKKFFFSFRDFEKTEKSIEEYRNEIQMHLREKDLLEKTIPNSIVIGPYFIFAQKLRDALSNKRKALMEALLVSQTRKARAKTEEVNLMDFFFERFFFIDDDYFSVERCFPRYSTKTS